MRTIHDCVKSAMMGLVVGDALGVPVEFQSREELKENPVVDMREFGTYHQPRGTWSDDSSMVIATTVSLREGLNYQDITDKFVEWASTGEYTPYGDVFDMGLTVKSALAKYTGKDPFECGVCSEYDNGNGSLMRILPIAFYLYGKKIMKEDVSHEAVQIIEDVSRITHGHVRSKMACVIYCYLLIDLICNSDNDKVVTTQRSVDKVFNYFEENDKKYSPDEISHYRRLFDVRELANRDETEINSNGYVVYTLEASLWCFITTDSYKQCLLKAVNLGEDTDTVAAIAGGLAGAYYGYNTIPDEWIKVIAKRDRILRLCEEFTDSLMR